MWPPLDPSANVVAPPPGSDPAVHPSPLRGLCMHFSMYACKRVCEEEEQGNWKKGGVGGERAIYVTGNGKLDDFYETFFRLLAIQTVA